MSRTIESELSLDDARGRILDRAEPGEAIEVSLGEALGLVLAEPVVADVDHPPFDRATRDGYAVRADEATVGTLLRIVEPSRGDDQTLESGEAARIFAGDPMPPGTDTVIRPAQVRPDPEIGPTRVIEIRRAGGPGRHVARRGIHLEAGTTVADAGTRIKVALVPLLAAQGCVHPFCHRRVRVSLVTVGQRWVRPDEAPSMGRERNAANAALVALTVRAEAMPHDFQAVAGPSIRPTLERAATSPIVVILGSSFRPVARPLRSIGYEPVVAGVAADLIGRARYGVLRDDDGQVVNHIFFLPADPVAASVGFALLVAPLLARLQGDAEPAASQTLTLPDGEPQPATGRRARLRRAIVRVAAGGRPVAELIPGPLDDLAGWSRTDGVVIFPDHAGPWQGGEAIDYLPIAPRA